GELKKELVTLLDGAGFELLRVIQDEIMRLGSVVTTNLLSSFTKGSSDSIYRLSEGGLTLEVGTNVKYASYVNDGHMANPPGVERRFVPGYWKNTRYGEKYIYDPGAETGMVLNQQFIEGQHYIESAVKIMEIMFPKFLEAKLDEWINSYF
ncbi:MAG: HK97 gp10 family phage protein, partial [Oscillospiraceae bacterium]|nr:HK97 gp10 family phage protein [Oscillospiraceae bacterium]